jgi:hypothetical protein
MACEDTQTSCPRFNACPCLHVAGDPLLVGRMKLCRGLVLRPPPGVQSGAMSTPPVDGAPPGIESWQNGSAGQAPQTPHPGVSPNVAWTPYDQETCPTCHKPRHQPAYEVERYDEDYDYYLGGMRLPLWIALIWNVPWRQRLDIFVIGFLVGLTIAGVALLWGLLLSRY